MRHQSKRVDRLRDDSVLIRNHLRYISVGIGYRHRSRGAVRIVNRLGGTVAILVGHSAKSVVVVVGVRSIGVGDGIDANCRLAVGGHAARIEVADTGRPAFIPRKAGRPRRIADRGQERRVQSVALDVVGVGRNSTHRVGRLRDMAQRIVNKTDRVANRIHHAGHKAVGIGRRDPVAVEILNVVEDLVQWSRARFEVVHHPIRFG